MLAIGYMVHAGSPNINFKTNKEKLAWYLYFAVICIIYTGMAIDYRSKDKKFAFTGTDLVNIPMIVVFYLYRFYDILR